MAGIDDLEGAATGLESAAAAAEAEIAVLRASAVDGARLSAVTERVNNVSAALNASAPAPDRAPEAPPEPDPNAPAP